MTEATIAPEILLRAMIEQAEKDLNDPHPHVAKDAFEWVYLTDDRSPWSFLWCCEQAGINPVDRRGQMLMRGTARMRRYFLHGGTTIYTKKLAHA